MVIIYTVMCITLSNGDESVMVRWFDRNRAESVASSYELDNLMTCSIQQSNLNIEDDAE